MKANTPSRTAQYMAFFRAIETERPKSKRLFTDKYAIHFLDNGLKAATKISGLPWVGSIIPKIIHNKALGALSSGTARTKYIDDLLYRTIQEGVQQVLILGAGFDTRAQRLDFLKQVSVVEIDHPDTSKFKMEKLRTVRTDSNHVKYLQLDFNQNNLNNFAQLDQINFSLPTTIIWEGVTNYLTQAAVDNTFEFASKFVSGSYIIFTYIHQEVLKHPESFEGTEKFFQTLHENEEPWTFGFLPQDLPDYLLQYQFAVLEDKGAADYRKQYMPERKGLLNGYEFYRVAFAKRK